MVLHIALILGLPIHMVGHLCEPKQSAQEVSQYVLLSVNPESGIRKRVTHEAGMRFLMGKTASPVARLWQLFCQQSLVDRLVRRALSSR